MPEKTDRRSKEEKGGVRGGSGGVRGEMTMIDRQRTVCSQHELTTRGYPALTMQIKPRWSKDAGIRH
jgi:hypothetical protein